MNPAYAPRRPAAARMDSLLVFQAGSMQKSQFSSFKP